MDAVTLQAGAQAQLPVGHWGQYVQTVIDRLTANFGPLVPAEIEISADLPPASGISSSSALLTGVALSLADLNDLWETRAWEQAISSRVDLAGYAASIENGRAFRSLAGLQGVGTSGGSLDHTGMLTSEAGRLSYAEFDPMHIIRTVPAPDGITFVIAVSGVLAEKTGAARDLYNRGPALLQSVLSRWNTGTGRTDATVQSALRHLVGPDLEAPLAEDDARFAELPRFAETEAEQRRLTQFLQESAVLVPSAVEALQAGSISRFSELVERSQSLAETHLGNQIPETIDLVSSARSLGAVAASSVGAGFGGSVWALVPAGKADAFAAAWKSAYGQQYDAAGATTIVTGAGPAAARVDDGSALRAARREYVMQ